MPTWVEGIDGDFALHSAVTEVLPKDAKVISAESWGLSAWTKTAKIVAVLPDGTQRRYFLKCATGKLAKIHMWGEHYSASIIADKVPDFGPKPVGRGEYEDETNTHVYFYLMEYHDMDIQVPPDPTELASSIARLHRNVVSPNGKFGYPLVTGRGTLNRKEHWSPIWADQFTHLLKDLIALDNQVNGPWPEYDAACEQLFVRVIPRLLGALQSEGRQITPVLCHGDLWEGNVATDMETGRLLIFDPDECMYAHNELEFATWRSTWATYFQSPAYIMAYHMEIEPSEPVEEWDDRHRLYSIKTAICDSAGHAGSNSRRIAYNDMLYLCEKYAPSKRLEKYDPEHDISVTGVQQPYDIMAGVRAEL
ncbi:Fructosamine kinase-domain-containing protein [Xylariomycetidae sp. FL0641]|nr:Fructosamine kinase-domain-containing protein [Xylariomycetidae sp. FL0641]